MSFRTYLSYRLCPKDNLLVKYGREFSDDGKVVELGLRKNAIAKDHFEELSLATSGGILVQA